MKFSKEFRIGVFVISVLITSLFVINYLRGKDLFNREMEVISYFDEVDGLNVSAPVFVKGFKAGKVTEVEYDSKAGIFKVTCSVLRDFTIPEDSKLTIYATDLLGSKGVKIQLGTSEVMAENGDCLASAFQTSMVDDLVAQVTPIMEKVSNTLDSLTVTVAGVNALLCEANQDNISKTLAHLEKTMKDVSSIAAVIEGRSADLDAFITNLSELSVKLNTVAEKVDGTVDGVSQVVGEISETDIKGVVETFHTLLKNINDPDGTFGKLLVDGSVYTSLDTLLVDVDTLVKKIQENPKKYMKISVF